MITPAQVRRLQQHGGCCLSAMLLGATEVARPSTVMLPVMIGTVKIWLGANSSWMGQQGYSMQPLLAQLDAAEAAWGAAEAAAKQQDYAAAATAVAELAGALRRVGAAASNLAVEPICNNPLCRTVRGASEAAMVSSRKCTKCRIAHYCSSDCHQQHWHAPAPKHSRVCKALVAAAAGPAGGVVADVN